MNAIWLRTCKAQNALTSRWYASAASLMNSDETYIAIWSNSQAMTVSLVESLKHHGRKCRGHLSTPVSWPLDPLPAASCKPLTICSSKAGASCCSSSPAKWKACEVCATGIHLTHAEVDASEGKMTRTYRSRYVHGRLTWQYRTSMD